MPPTGDAPKMPLTDIICKNAKPEAKSRKIADEKGLYLEVMPSGSKYFRMKYRFGGKEKRLAFGVYPEVTLKEARDRRDEARKLIREGIDPAEQKKREKLTRHINTENTFEKIAREWHAKQSKAWKERHAKYVIKRLEADIFPALGFRPISEITAPELLAALKEVEKRGALDIAKRLLQTTGQIFRYAISLGKAKHDLSADLKGILTPRKKGHYNKLPESALPEFLQKLEVYDSEYEGELQTKLGLKLLIATFVRTTELREARWEEFDFDKKEWRIPAERMKMDEEHIVPLSKQALAIIEQIKEISHHSELLFPNSRKPMQAMSNNTMLFALYRMGYRNRTTTHGFRSVASTILHEKGFPSEIIELQLSHAERNKVKASYNFAKYLPERREMMQWWADYLDRALAGGGNVLEGKFGGKA